MRTKGEEASPNLWARLLPIAMLLFLSCIVCAEIETTPVAIKGGTLYESLDVVGSADIASVQIEDKAFRIYADEKQTEPIMDFKVLNNVDERNIITDCQNTPYTCDFKVSITPIDKNIRLDNDLLSGGWKDGEASIKKIFFYQNTSYTYDEPIYAWRDVEEYKDENGTIIKGHSELYLNTTKLATGYHLIEQEDLTQAYAKDGVPIEVIIRFARPEIKKVDIYPSFLGEDYTQFSYWGTGGTETTYLAGNGTNMTVHTFTANGTFAVNNSLCVHLLIVAGGGGGGKGGSAEPAGAGGAGGLIDNSSVCLNGGVNYAVIVGKGGEAASNAAYASNNGTNSSFGNSTWNYSAKGGGGGSSGGVSSNDEPAGSGGSGGGGNGLNQNTGAAGTAGQGYAGGDGVPAAGYSGGGGGGANGTGVNGSGGQGGLGGAGYNSSINGSRVCYAGGGGGASWSGGTNAFGGCGVNGTGGKLGGTEWGTAGVCYGCGGGAGVNFAAGAVGGDGIVILSYPTLQVGAIIPTLLSPTNNTAYPLNTTSVPISFNCSGDSNTNYFANLTVNNGNYDNATAIIAYNNASTNFTINMSITTNGSFVWGVLCYNSSTSTASSNRTFVIRNFAPNITSLTIVPNGSVYQLDTLYLNITVSHLDLHQTNISYSWLRNGVNQTSMAGNVEVQPGANTQINNTATPFTADDNWSVSVYAYDVENSSATNTTSNTTIQNYFGNLSFYAPPANTHIYTQAYLNFTLRNAISASAYFVFGASNTTMTNSGTGSNYIFTTTTAIASSTTNGTWYYKATLANSSTFELSYSESINVSNAGFFLCNSSINTTSIFYQFQDAVLFTPINATFTGTYVWVGDDSVSTSVVLSNTSTDTSICVYPSTFNRAAVATEVASASGYLTSVVTVPITNYSAGSLNKTVYLINTSAGAFYTFQTINQYSTPISGTSVVVLKVGDTIPITYIADITGSVYVPLIQLSTYTVNVSASGYNNVSFPFVAGSTTTIQIKLSISGAGVSPPNYTNVFQTVQYVLLPDSTSIDNTTPIVFSTSSPNGTLQSFGLYIFKNYQGNSTLVFNSSSTNTTGGSLSYQATSEGMYAAYPWFKAVGYANYTPFPTTFSYGNATSPTSQAAAAIQGGGIISGWSYYFVALVIAMLVAVGLSRYTIDGAAFGGLAVLVLATILNPSIIVYDFGMFAVTPVHLTTMAGVISASVLYLRQYGV